MFEELTNETWQFQISRDLRVGPPNSGKTHSLLTNERPLYIISYPGEKGSSTIPANVEGVKAYVWKEDDVTKNSPAAIIKSVRELTLEIISGKRAPIGPIASFAGDGLHKLYSHFWLREYRTLLTMHSDRIAQGKVTEDELKIRAYGNENYGACRDFMEYVTLVYNSTIPHVTFTCWEGVELDTPELKSKSGSHIFPDFPGKLAKRIMGEFALVLYSHLEQQDTPKGAVVKAKWQLRPGGKVWGAGAKVPPEIASRLPREIEQDWKKLLGLLNPTTSTVTQ